MAATTIKSTMRDMGMWNSDRVARRLLLRWFLLLCGGLGALWSSSAIPSFWLMNPAREISAHIAADDRFKTGAITEMLMRLRAVERPALLQPEFSRAEALMTLRAVEETMQRNSLEQIDHGMENAENKIKAALFANPTDSFLWLMLYSVKTTRTGFDLRNISFLEHSYAMGPNEAWVALRRNPLALAVFAILPGPVQDAVISEFANTVDSDFIAEAELTLTGVGWPHRERLLGSLAGVDLAPKQALRKRLSNAGIKVSIPGIEIDERPW
ncbi:hypothetical protein GWG65_30825 [Bradyrhizobium sp. CSA207]|uniref:hypothetical protein n=1 Tax=Bradyrhizobium sp. CSA207 TaxID=2698826 RepID=UPI0023AFE8ED|nr:hypothetical protein [Bradyrhizobium sp. CSA207]MDE5445727.1 hypothetical protein [Bradyrhizobium sp. CSA207]